MQILVYPGEVPQPLLNTRLAADFLKVLRDVAERGRNIEGCIKQWFQFVKPNFERYVEPQRKVAGKFNHSTQFHPNGVQISLYREA
jgi:uridine kinase